jgi:hypothetical protein
MSMRKVIWAGAIAVMAAGCTGNVDGPGAVKGEGDPTLFSTSGGCSNPTYGCTHSNGTGVYFQEGGNAYFDNTYKMMITHFGNNSANNTVWFEGRFHNPYDTTGNPYQTLYGNVYQAWYQGTTWSVTLISASGGAPYVKLHNTSGDLQIGAGGLNGLYLYLNFRDPNPNNLRPVYRRYEIEFYNPGLETSPVNWDTPPSLYEYSVYWWSLNNDNTSGYYCTAANGSPDIGTFMDGVAINPTSGQVTRGDSTLTTFSCRLGAPAVSHLWGYDYTFDAWHFASAIHMKRASYCGDSNYFTVSGTQIAIADNEGANWNWTGGDAALEAEWTPNGASCFTQSRRPDATLIQLGITPFDSTTYNSSCNGSRLPTCPSTSTLTGTYLIDHVVPQ